MTAGKPLLVITGAAGALGRLLAGQLGDSYRLRLVDKMPCAGGGEVVTCDISDPAAAHAALAGADCVVHLAGQSLEAPWAEILQANIVATYNVFEAARLAGVKRFVFASSHHVVGFYPRNQVVGVDAPVRPDTRYAVSKVFGEALGRLYADKHGMSVVCQRIGVARPKPPHARALWAWQSEPDYVAFTRCCLAAPDIRFIVVYGVSRNSRKLWDSTTADVIGYRPQDDAELHAAAIERVGPEPAFEARFHGGAFCAQEFDGDVARIDGQMP